MPTEIEDWNDLNAIDDTDDGDYVLVNDLDSDTAGYAGVGDDWDPIGLAEDPGDSFLDGFQGTFNGQGHEIRDLIIDVNHGDVGLFGSVRGGDGSEVIENLGVIGDVSSSDSSNNVGILVGDYRDADALTNCYVSGTVSANDMEGVGGMVGISDESGISNCYSLADVTGDERVGGYIGNTGLDSGISECYAAGSVSGNIDVGGFVGLSSNDPTASFWDTEATGQDTDGADETTGLPTADMQGDLPGTTMDEFDYEGIWSAVTGGENADSDGYPILRDISMEGQGDTQNITISEFRNPPFLAFQVWKDIEDGTVVKDL